MKKRMLLILVLACLSLYKTFGQTGWTLKMDTFLNALAEHHKMMGSLAISKNGELLYAKAVGITDMKGKEQFLSNTQTKYRIGSVTKLMTSTLILQLVEDKKMTLETKLSVYFPHLKNAKKITIAQLLNHRSGIHDFTQDIRYSQWMTEPMATEQLLRIISGYPSDFSPGSRHDYSNSNYWLLGQIIEKICNKSYQAVLDDRINTVAGLTQTHYGSIINSSTNECHSYRLNKGEWVTEPETHPSIPHGAGAIISTPSDLTLFADALFNGKLLNEKSLQHMKTMKDGYGDGMLEFSFGEKKWLGHDGLIDGFESIVINSPEDKLSIAFCANGVNYPLTQLIRDVLNIYSGKNHNLPAFDPISISPQNLQNYIGAFLCEKLSLRVNVTTRDSQLIVQAEGQNAFSPYASAKDLFRFDKEGVVLQFYPEKKEFLLNQNGKAFLFKQTDSVVPGSISLKATITDADTHEPIPFANIGISGKRIGTVSDEFGRFQLQLPADQKIDSVVISMIGYERHKTALSFFKRGANTVIAIRPQAKSLEEVTVQARKWKHEKLGNTPLISGILKGQFPGENGAEVGIPVTIKNGPATLDEFNFYVLEGEEDSLKFRLNIYTVSKDGMPEKNMLTRNIYFETPNKQGWVHVDLKPYNLVVNDTIFVSIQYIKGYHQYKYFSAGYAGTKALTRDASESYWEETPVSAAMNVVVKR